MEIDIPRDREGEFEPKIIAKYKRDISEIEDKIIALYSRAIATRDIHEQIKDIYGIEVSAEMVSKITEKIIPENKRVAKQTVGKDISVYSLWMQFITR